MTGRKMQGRRKNREKNGRYFCACSDDCRHCSKATPHTHADVGGDDNQRTVNSEQWTVSHVFADVQPPARILTLTEPNQTGIRNLTARSARTVSVFNTHCRLITRDIARLQTFLPAGIWIQLPNWLYSCLSPFHAVMSTRELSG